MSRRHSRQQAARKKRNASFDFFQDDLICICLEECAALLYDARQVLTLFAFHALVFAHANCVCTVYENTARACASGCLHTHVRYVCTVYKYLPCAALNDGGMARCCPKGRCAQKEPALAQLDVACVCVRLQRVNAPSFG